MSAKVLVLKTGTTHPELVARDGDYDAWFVRSLPCPPEDVTVVPVYDGAPLPPNPEDYGGIILTGSPLSVRDEAPWMRALGEWAVARAEAGQPVLGVCFGHQLIGEVLGGRVEQNPNGREAGTVEVQLTAEGAADPLFEGFPAQLVVQATHNDALVVPPSAPGVRRLAGNSNTPWQAFAWGEHLRAVQFHPELADTSLQTLLDLRGWEGSTRPSTHGEALLRAWYQRWVAKA